ncbi:hypothetical protein PDL71_10320 [Lacibacter sp. MH-610]|uniref:hypothetical protein n=1 Tax=Lacibacter sp. MH-610 TaxID=3020883 RepID=UPI003891BE19
MQENCETAYEELKSEIENLHLTAVTAVKENPILSNLLKGYKVFYSPLLYKPKVLFIGINPGNGEEGVYDCEHCDKGELEYLHYNYTLADETKKVFEMACKSEALYNSVKTNYYYLATTSGKDIFKITDFLGRQSKDDLGEQLIVNARKWTKRLIETMEPELIICEGVEAYANVTDLFQEGIKMKEDVEYVYVEEIEANIIGYKRTYSNINNKSKLASTIATLLS